MNSDDLDCLEMFHQFCFVHGRTDRQTHRQTDSGRDLIKAHVLELLDHLIKLRLTHWTYNKTDIDSYINNITISIL